MLKVVDLVKVYKPKKGAAVHALDGVNLEIEDKGLVFLLGKSGSGKSTLLNLLGGLDTYTSGDIVIKGKSTKDFNQSNFDSYRNTFIGFIFQEFNILEDYTVGQNIGMALELQHKPNDRAAVEELLAQVDLEGYYDRKPNELSGGQKQRIAIARALIKKPEIIMADEPTGALDSKTGKSVFETLKKIGEHKLVMVVTHDRENAEFYADRIIELADGKVISDRIRSGETGVLEEKNFSVIDDKLIRIKAGSNLDAKDLLTLSEWVRKSNEDVFVSLDTVQNTAFVQKANAVVGKSGTSRGGFEDTTPEKIQCKTYDPSAFKLVKSRLPFKDSFRMGASGLKHKKVRLVFTIFLSFIAFAMAGFASTVSLFNREKSEFDTMRLSKAKNVAVRSLKGNTFMGVTDFSTYGAPGFSSEQLSKLTDLTGTQPLRVVQSDKSNTRLDLDSQMPDYDERTATAYDATQILQLVEVPSADDAHLTPIGDSRLPTKMNEIAISDYIADSFIKFGYCTPSGEGKVDIKKPEELIGKKINAGRSGGSNAFTIVGVYKTDIDMTAFDRYKEQKAGLMSQMVFSADSLMMGMGYVMPGFTEKLENMNQGSQYFGEVHLREQGITGSTGRQQFGILSPATDELLTEPLNPYGLKAAQLTDDEMVLSFKQALYSMPKFIEKFIELGGSEQAEQIQSETAKQAFDSLLPEDKRIEIAYDSNNGEGWTPDKQYTVAGIVLADDNTITDYANSTDDKFIQQRWDLVRNGIVVSQAEVTRIAQKFGLQENRPQDIADPQIQLQDFGIAPDPDGQTGEAFRPVGLWNYIKFSARDRWGDKDSTIWADGVTPKTQLADDEIVLSFEVLRNMNGQNHSDGISESQAKKMLSTMRKDIIWGRTSYGSNGYVVDSGKKMKVVGISQNNVYISDALFDEIKELSSAPKTVVITLTGNAAKDNAIFKYISDSVQKEKNATYKLAFSTSITPLMDFASSLLGTLRMVFMYAALAFCIFAALMLMNFIGTSVSFKKKDIGVLRAIGARGVDVFKIFFNEGLVIGVINFVLASVSLAVASIVINQALGVAVMLFNVLPYLLMAGLSLLVVLLSTYLSVHKIARKKPIDAINNR